MSARGSAPPRIVDDMLREAAAILRQAGIEEPGREARLLLAHAAGLEQAALLRDRRATLDVPGLDALVARRARREPLALILGRQGFWSLDLEVSADTLVPRADSETLIEAALAVFPDRHSVRRVLDLGTGTGCLLLAALTEFPDAWGLGVDRVSAAAALAARNAGRAGLGHRTSILCGEWADAIVAQFDLILANPPYISSAEIPGLMPEVAGHEPATALDGGTDGLDAYRAILPELPRLIAAGGAAILELGAGQAALVAPLARASGFADVATRQDLAGVARALIVRQPC